MKSPVVLLAQLGVIGAAAPAFWAAGRLLEPRSAFVIAFLFYWAAMLVTGAGLLARSPDRATALGALFGRPAGLWVPALAFVPAAAALIAEFVPALGAMGPALFIVVLGLALVNGLVEELFWRGLTAAEYGDSTRHLAISTLLFGAFHLLFLLIPLRYEGGAFGLVGGSLFMGGLWLFVTIRAQSLTTPILAHQLVNVLAFTALGVLNGWSF